MASPNDRISEEFALDVIDRFLIAGEDLFKVLSPYPAMKTTFALLVGAAVIWVVVFSVLQGWRLIFMLPFLKTANGPIKTAREHSQPFNTRLDNFIKYINGQFDAINKRIDALVAANKRDPKSRTRATDFPPTDSPPTDSPK